MRLPRQHVAGVVFLCYNPKGKRMTPKDVYILYDERAILESVDEASVLDSWIGQEFASEEDIIRDAKDTVRNLGFGGLLCSYESKAGTNDLHNERRVMQFVGNKATDLR